MENKSRSGKGFTLAELLMVVAIIGILAAFGFVAVAQHQRDLKLSEMDNTAREIFVAAQNHLTESDSSGEWDALYSENYSDTSASSYLGADATQEIVDATDCTDLTDDEIQNKKKHDFRVLVYPATTTSTDSAATESALDLMLPEGSIDETVRTEGSYIIEYDALTATVYGVFYSTSTNLTTSDVKALNESNGRTDSSVREDYTKDNTRTIVGYYGGATGEDTSYSKSTDQAKAGYTLQDISLYFENDSTLRLVLEDPNPDSLSSQQTNNPANADYTYTYTVTITLSDAHGNQVTLHPLTANTGLDGLNSDITKGTGHLAAEDSTVTDKSVTRYIYTLDSIVGSSSLATGTESYVNYHFGAQFPTLYLGDTLSATAQIKVTWNKKNSTVTEASSATKEVKAKNTANSLFANATSGSTAKISNIRHLENLSTIISGIDSKEEGVLTDNITSAEITSDLDWGKFKESLPTNFKLDSNTICSLKDNHTSSTFVGIVNDKLTSLTGNTEDKSTATITGLTISVEEDFKEDTNDPTGAGLIASADHGMEISNLTLTDFSVSATGASTDTYSLGALIGAAYIDSTTGNQTFTISDVTISNSSITNSSNSGSNVGYLIGSMNYNGKSTGSINIDSCTVNVTSGNLYADNAGGFVGYAMANTLTVEDSNIKGSSQYTIYGNNAGGLIGKAVDCTTVISGVNLDSSVGLLVEGIGADSTASSAGGYVGAATVSDSENASSLTISSSKVNGILYVGTASGDSTNTTYNAGGLVGLASDTSVTLKDLTIVATTLTVNAKSTAGGLVGDVEETAAADLAVTVSKCNVQIVANSTGNTTDNIIATVTAYGADEGASGGFIGKVVKTENATGSLAVTVTDSNITGDGSSKLAVNGKAYAGGFLGTYESTKNTSSALTLNALTISTSKAEIKITADNNENAANAVSGGIAGLIQNAGTLTLSNSSITSDIVTVSVSNSASVLQSAGGAVGALYYSDTTAIPTAKMDSVSIKATTSLTVNNINGTKGSAGGLIGTISAGTENALGAKGDYRLTVSNCSVLAKDDDDTNDEKLSVHASGNAGGAIGELLNIYSSISNCTVIGGAEGLVLSDQANAGGFVGLSECATNKGAYTNYTDDTASVLVQTGAVGDSADDTFGVGGFAGKIENAGIFSCYAAGRTNNQSYDNGTSGKTIYDRNVYASATNPVGTISAGGLVGYCYIEKGGYLTIQNSFTTCSVLSDATTAGNTFTGGMIGYYANSVAYNDDRRSKVKLTTINSYCTGLVSASDGYAGIFIGGMDSFREKDFAKGSETTPSSQYLLNINDDSTDVCGYLRTEDATYTINTIQSLVATGVSKTDLAGDESAATDTYDSKLTGSYPYKTLQQLNSGSSVTTYTGDWPVPETTEDDVLYTLDNDVAIVYYEIVQHPDNTKEFYYHGYKMNFATSKDYKQQSKDTLTTANDMSEIQTKDTLKSRYSSISALINDSDKNVHNASGEEYVVESGYVVLFDKNSTTNQKRGYVSDDTSNAQLYVNTGKGDTVGFFNNSNITAFNTKAYENNTETLAEELGYKDTVLYYISPNIFTEWTAGEEGLFWLQYTKDTGNTSHFEAQFYLNPYASDRIDVVNTESESDGVYDIYMRSARQMIDLFADGGSGNKFLHNAGQKTNVYQTMDISFDNSVIDFTEKGTSVDYASPTVTGTMTASYYGAIVNDDGSLGSRIHTLKHITNTLVNALHDGDNSKKKSKPCEIAYVNFVDLEATIVNENAGVIYEITVDNSVLGNRDTAELVNVIATTNNNQASAKIYSCEIKNVHASGSCVVGANGNKIDDITIDNCVIGGNGVADSSTGSISNCSIEVSTINNNGITGANSGSIATCSIENTSIGGHGVAEASSGSITGCTITKSDITGNGISASNSGSITDCSITSTPITGYGVTGTNDGKISGCTITNSSVGNNGISSSNSSSGSIADCSTTSTPITGYGVTGTNDGKISGCKVTDSSIGKNGISSSNSKSGSIADCSILNTPIGGNGVTGANDGSITGCTITGSDIGNNGISDSNSSSGSITDCVITGSNIGNNGITGTNSGKITNCSIGNAKITADGVAETNSASITGTKLTNVTVLGTGFVNKNSETIDNCDLVNAHISGTGFTDLNEGSITNCQIYADTAQYPSSEISYYSSKDKANGYLLTTVGIVYNDDSSTSIYTGDDSDTYTSAGFVNTNKGTIDGCSFTGSVYGVNETAGFFIINKGTIRNSYSNAYVNCGGKSGAIGAGFGVLVTAGNNPNISYCHSTGKIVGGANTIQAGFLYKSDDSAIWTYVQNSYSAMWSMNQNANDDPFCCISWESNDNNAFRKDGQTMGDAYLLISDSFTSRYDSVNAVTESTLTDPNNKTWGTAASEDNSHPYYVFITEDAGKTDPYPMPSYQNTVSDSYGDWYDAEHMNTVKAESVTVYGEIDGAVTTLGLEENISIYQYQKLQLWTEIEPMNGTADITWTSSDDSIATVKDGQITGISPGKATITVKSDSDVYAVINITVMETTDSITIYQDSEKTQPITELQLGKGMTQKLYAGLNSGQEGVTYKWSSSDNSIVSVTDDGTITAGTTEGTAIITVSIENRYDIASVSCQISVVSLLSKTGIDLTQLNAQQIEWKNRNYPAGTVLTDGSSYCVTYLNYDVTYNLQDCSSIKEAVSKNSNLVLLNDQTPYYVVTDYGIDGPVNAGTIVYYKNAYYIIEYSLTYRSDWKGYPDTGTPWVKISK